MLKPASAATRTVVAEARGVTEAAEEKDAACSRDGAEERDAPCSQGGAGCWAVPVIEEGEIVARDGTAVELALRHLAAEQGETGAEAGPV